jgi:hypothetical protein
MPRYDARDWYWVIAQNTTQVFSSARALSVPVADGTYQNWLSAGGWTVPIASEAELYDVLTVAAPAAAASAAPAWVSGDLLTPQQAHDWLISAGLTITSTGTAAVNGTYAVDDGTRTRINAIVTGLNAVPPTFPAGLNPFPWNDMSNVAHNWQGGTTATTGRFFDFAFEVRDYIEHLNATLLARQGSNPTAPWPSSSVTIA